VDASVPDGEASQGSEVGGEDVRPPEEARGADTLNVEKPTLIARWVLIGFEDPLTINFITDGDSVFGIICWVYMDCEETPSITGSRKELNVAFGTRSKIGFTFTGALAADGSRIGGTFKTSEYTLTVAWLRLPPGKELLDLDPSKFLIAPPEGKSVDLKLLQRPPGSSQFDTDKTYRFWLTHYAVFGDLGAFWHTERTPNAPSTIQHPDGRVLKAISLGPVASTRADLPTKLTVGTTDDKLQAVWLTMPGGSQFLFGP